MNRLSYVFLTFIMVSFSVSVKAQKSSTKKSTQKSLISTAPTSNTREKIPLLFEKVYVHTDREIYAAGEDIWMKAYLVNAQSNYFSTNSNNLYIELISPKLEIKNRITIRLNDGVGNGDFKVSDSIVPGVYRLRAYTKWMLNFENNFVFEKELSIHGKSKPKTEQILRAEKKKAILNDTASKDADYMAHEIKFMPEGGSLITGVANVVAFKSVDAFGFGYQSVKGVIISSKNDTITKFESIFQGMGKFSFTPIEGEKYFAVGFSELLPFKKELPSALKSGYTMRIINNSKDSIFTVIITTNEQTFGQKKNEELSLQATTFNRPIYGLKFGMEKQNVSIRIPKKDFPTGIARITLYDNQKRPNCERAIYVEQNDASVRISIKANKNQYTTRDKVVLNIKATNSQNQPIVTNLSLAVTDSGIVNNPSKTILTYLMLESEVKGKIENPTYYFDPANLNRYKMLDLLLLTQGWRDFVWKNIADTLPTLKLKYLMEQGLEISGRLKMLLFDRPLKNKNITLQIQPLVTLDKAVTEKPTERASAKDLYNSFKNQKKITMYQTNTDDFGKYVFTGLEFYGKMEVSLRAFNSKKEDSNGAGELLLDSVAVIPFLINKPLYTPKILPKMEVFAIETEKKAKILRKYTLKDTILLNDFTIKEQRNPDMVDEFVYIDRITFTYKTYEFTAADFIGYKVFDQLLYDKIPGTMTTSEGDFGYKVMSAAPKEKKAKGQGSILSDMVAQRENTNVSTKIKFFDDPKTYSKGFFDIPDDFPLDRVAKIIVDVKRDIKHSDYLNITIYCKHGVQMKKDYSLIVEDVSGYYTSRVFYATDYSLISKDNIVPDLRSTVYWNPNIVTNEEGEAEVTFYNGDMKTQIRTVVEGLSKNGIPVVATSSYNVK